MNDGPAGNGGGGAKRAPGGGPSGKGISSESSESDPSPGAGPSGMTISSSLSSSSLLSSGAGRQLVPLLWDVEAYFSLCMAYPAAAPQKGCKPDRNRHSASGPAASRPHRTDDSAHFHFPPLRSRRRVAADEA